MTSNEAAREMRMDASQLYREEVFTDRKVGSIQRLTPVDGEGAVDTTREILFLGQTQILTPAGAMPLSFELPATNLTEAIDKFPAAAQQALERTMEELQEMRRQASSSVVVPGRSGGKIQIP